MPSPRDNLGKYELTLGNQKLEESIVSAELSQYLDQPSRLEVRIAADYKRLSEINGNDLPQSASFKWLDRGIFKGGLTRSQVIGASQLVLLYEDPLAKAPRVRNNGMLKQQSLKDILEKLAQTCGMKTRFQGDFSEMLPAHGLAGKSIFEHLQSLSNKYGYYFVHRSYGDTLYFIRLGESIKKTTLDVEKSAAEIHGLQSSAESYSDVRVRYFDAKTLENKEKQISQNAAYSSIQSWGEHPLFRQKLSWPLAGGSVEAHVTDRYHFDSADSLVGRELSKKLMNQETVLVTGHEPFALPGDGLKLENSPSPGIEDGEYFVKGLTVAIGSAAPRAAIEAIRP